MSKQVYISADYDQSNGDQNVVDELNKWGKQNNQTTTSNFPCNFNFTVSNMNRFN